MRPTNNGLWNLTGKELLTNAEQIFAEQQVLSEFFDRTDANGLAIPEDSQQLRARIEKLARVCYSDLEALKIGEQMWPPDELLSLIGLAQHYGLPTRILDWSRHAGKAAQFAAKGAAEKCVSLCKKEDSPDGRYLAVWALSTTGLRGHLKMEESAGRKVGLVTVTAPRSGNPNLHAQEGLFTLFRPERQPLSEPVDRRPLDQLLQAEEVTRKIDSPKRPLFYRFTLPIAESGKLLYMLAKDGVDSASLFPGYDGIVKTLYERGLWDRDK